MRYYTNIIKKIIRVWSAVVYSVSVSCCNSFIPMSGCVGMCPSALIFLGARDVAKTALLLLLLSKKQ